MAKTFDQSLDEIARLVKHYQTNRTAFHAPGYKEAHARQNLIDPLFIALDWDVYNAERAAPQYQPVVLEDSLETETGKKAPDYAFRIGRDPAFFAEAKKPAESIKTNPDHAYQLRRYAWSAKLPLSILTDFEELAVYDCRTRPSDRDKVSASRISYLTFEEYPDRWRELWDVFSYGAVRSGSFDQYAQTAKGKRGTSEVDAEFLKEIERWRDVLAHNIALRNPRLSIDELNDAVQRTIDRLIFLRMAEDRSIEPYGKLLALTPTPSAASPVRKASTGEGSVYAGLIDLCRAADAKYNSGLFDFSLRGDALALKLKVDDSVLKPILAGLYYPQSPYEFSVLPAEILGSVYEQFLGKVIRLTPSHHAKVEEKPEVKKAGGVYYTPAYIVEYIVKNTVGKLVEGKAPKQLEGFRVLDMACGSGSFLLGAYQHLLDYYLRWYVEHNPEKHPKAVWRPPLSSPPQSRGDRGWEWRLTTAEKKRILTTHIFGVDIDRQAAEVTKLSLLLKVLEGESDETLGQQLALLPERALPNLDANIKCGNSLIGPDYFSGQLMPDTEELKRVNPFDWQREFPDAMKAGGFDCVIGNPPWGADLNRDDERYFRSTYEVARASAIDSYSLFIEQAIRCLKPDGLLGYITPDTFLRKDDLLPTRAVVLQKATLLEFVETGPLFSRVRDTWCLILIVAKMTPTDASTVRHRKLSRFITSVEDRLSLFGKGEWSSETKVKQSVWLSRPKLIVGYRATELEQWIIAKMERNPSLGELSESYRISRGEEGSKFAITAHSAGKFYMVIPEHVERYAVDDGTRIAASTLTPTKVESLYTHPKIWIIRIQKMRWKQRIVCAFDGRTNSAGMKTLQIIVSPQDDIASLKYLSAILSSRLMNFWCVNYLTDDLNQSYLERIPVFAINFSDPADRARHDKIVSLVQQMLDLHNRLAAATAPRDREVLQRQIDATDKQIDALVYELYELTEDEIRVVEGG